MVKWDAVKEGDSVTPMVKDPIKRDEIIAYGNAGGDTNPIHMNEKAAEGAGLGGVIAHGLYNMALVCHMMTNWIGKDGKLKRIDVQFRGMVRPGDRVTSTGKITKKYVKDGEKCVDIDIVQEAKTPVASGTILQFEKVDAATTEAMTRQWLKGGDNLLFEVTKECSTEIEKDGKKLKRKAMDYKIWRVQSSILGSATAVLS